MSRTVTSKHGLFSSWCMFMRASRRNHKNYDFTIGPGEKIHTKWYTGTFRLCSNVSMYDYYLLLHY